MFRKILVAVLFFMMHHQSVTPKFQNAFTDGWITELFTVSKMIAKVDKANTVGIQCTAANCPYLYSCDTFFGAMLGLRQKPVVDGLKSVLEQNNTQNIANYIQQAANDQQLQCLKCQKYSGWKVVTDTTLLSNDKLSARLYGTKASFVAASSTSAWGKKLQARIQQIKDQKTKDQKTQDQKDKVQEREGESEKILRNPFPLVTSIDDFEGNALIVVQSLANGQFWRPHTEDGYLRADLNQGLIGIGSHGVFVALTDYMDPNQVIFIDPSGESCDTLECHRSDDSNAFARLDNEYMGYSAIFTLHFDHEDPTVVYIKHEGTGGYLGLYKDDRVCAANTEYLNSKSALERFSIGLVYANFM